MPVREMPHILVVDDDTRLRELLRKFLSDNGFRVTVAANAGEARNRMAGLQFDLANACHVLVDADRVGIVRVCVAADRRNDSDQI